MPPQFLVQADWLLVANREDIERESDWNKNIRDNLVDILIQAVHILHETPLRYLWPSWLPQTKGIMKHFFYPVFSRLNDRLKKEPVLESLDGSLITPSSAVSLPEIYKVDAVPLVPQMDASVAYLATGYDLSLIHI